MSERRRRGRGLEAIFDNADLSLDEPPAGERDDEPRRRSSTREDRAHEPPAARKDSADRTPAVSGEDFSKPQPPAEDSDARDPEREPRGRDTDGSGWEPQDRGGGETGERYTRTGRSAHVAPTPGNYESAAPDGRRAPGRPSGSMGQPRRLLQKGFYLELEQDQMLDQIRSSLKSTGFTPDRSAIVRAAVESFYSLDPAEQEEMVRRLK